MTPPNKKGLARLQPKQGPEEFPPHTAVTVSSGRETVKRTADLASITGPPDQHEYQFVDVGSIATTTGVSKRTVFRWIESGHFPPADLSIGQTQRWLWSTVRTWIEVQTAKGKGRPE